MQDEPSVIQKAYALYTVEQPAEALQVLGSLLCESSASADALNLAAACAAQANRLDEAMTLWHRATVEHPGHVAAFMDLGSVLLNTGRLEEAEPLLQHALMLEPSNAAAHFNVALCDLRRERAGHAKQRLTEAIRLDPDLFVAHGVLASLLRQEGLLDDAEASYRHALRLRNDIAAFHRELGELFMQCGRFAEAEASLLEALRCDPGNANALRALGAVRRQLGREAEAAEAELIALVTDVETEPSRMEAFILGALEDRPTDYALWAQLGHARRVLGQLDAAEVALRRACELQPADANIRFNLGTLMLRMGRYEEGWVHYEARLEDKAAADAVGRYLTFPRWKGESLAGKSILVIDEQGLGDTIQFIRYVRMLRRKGAATLSVLCPPALHTLIEEMRDVTRCVRYEDLARLPRHDYWCYTMSLPAVFGTTLDSIPSRCPYLNAPAAHRARWRHALPPGGLRVGLVWAGSSHENQRVLALYIGAVNQRRSLHVSALLPLLRVPGITFVSLQKGDTAARQMADLPPSLRPFDPMPQVRDFADTAAIVEQLDLVITVDTSTAHLAGALNKPVWILSRHFGCWRWLHRRQDTPWYPSARLFVQENPGDWGKVVERVKQALHEWAASRKVACAR
jgi:tetratricopeptide (TPR) repeat protein